MATPTPTTPDRITPTELRNAFQALNERLDQIEIEVNVIRATVHRLRDDLAAAASQPQATQPATGQTIEFVASSLLVGVDDNGTPTYKIKGSQYMKFGVRVWPETLPELGIDPATLRPGPNPVSLRVCALMGEKGPRKVIGLAR